MPLKNLLDIPLPKWPGLMLSLGQPAFRAQQLAGWAFQSPATDFSQMTDLPLSLRQKLESTFRLESLTALKEVASREGKARKALFRLPDGKTIESVLLAYEGRLSVCVSTQVGCAVGCPFCATGQQGFERHLSVAEIADQVLYFARRLEAGRRISHVVFMGMGEPLANYAATWGAVEALNSPQGFRLAARHIAISTAGLAPQIIQLSREPLQVGLAVSLHAAQDSLRNQLVPINRRYPLKELLSASREYVARTGRRITFEYVLFDGINDSPQQARQLAQLIRGMDALVNLIPANASAALSALSALRTPSLRSERTPILRSESLTKGDGSQFRAPPRERCVAFLGELERLGVKATLRARRGVDIAAGCGQLRSWDMALV